MSIGQNKSIRKNSPEWNRIYKARRERHPTPKIQIIYNDHTLGWFHNDGKKMSNYEFISYIKKYIEENKKDCDFYFFYGKDILGHKVIKKAVLYFDK